MSPKRGPLTFIHLYVGFFTYVCKYRRNKNYRFLIFIRFVGSHPLTYLFDTISVCHLIISRRFALLDDYVPLLRVFVLRLTFYRSVLSNTRHTKMKTLQDLVRFN